MSENHEQKTRGKQTGERQNLESGTKPRNSDDACTIVNVLYSIVDRIYIGNMPDIGDLALAGVGICGPIVPLLASYCTNLYLK